jgi:hypothetical protein
MLQVTSGLSGLPVSFISGVRSGVPDFVKLVAKILGLKDRLRCRGCGRKGRAVARSSGGIRRLSRAPGLRCAHPGKGAAPGRRTPRRRPSLTLGSARYHRAGCYSSHWQSMKCQIAKPGQPPSSALTRRQSEQADPATKQVYWIL